MTSEAGLAEQTAEAVDRSSSAPRGPDPSLSPSADRMIPVGGGLTIEVAPHHCFACGALNEHGIHLDLHVDGDRCWTEVVLSDRFQGWDGIAHGGIVCTILDEVMAWSLAATDNWGLTARMSVAFKRPVRLAVAVRGEGWITATRRRLIDTTGRLIDPASGEVLATATATYVAADPERKRELRARYGFRLAPDKPAPQAVPTTGHQAGEPNERRAGDADAGPTR